MIDQHLLRETLRKFIAKERISVSAWCRQGDPQLPQSTVSGFLNERRNAGRDLLIKLCARMRLKPQNFYKSQNEDVLRERLGLLNDMILHPDFPFGNQGQFEAIAALVETTYAHIFKNKE